MDKISLVALLGFNPVASINLNTLTALQISSIASSCEEQTSLLTKRSGEASLNLPSVLAIFNSFLVANSSKGIES